MFVSSPNMRAKPLGIGWVYAIIVVIEIGKIIPYSMIVEALIELNLVAKKRLASTTVTALEHRNLIASAILNIWLRPQYGRMPVRLKYINRYKYRS